MTWTGFGKTDIGVSAWHLPNDGTDDAKVRLTVATSYVDLGERQRRELAEYLLEGLVTHDTVS